MSETESSTPRIVVGVDGSEHSKLALQWAARIAVTEGARIEAVAAWEIPTMAYGYYGEPETERAEMKKMLAETVAEVFGDRAPVDITMLTQRGGPAQVLIDAGAGALLLVVGSRGRGGFAGLLLGSVSSKVAAHATCPVLVVHGEPPDAAAAS